MTVSYAFAESLPQEINLDRARQLLELYYNFSRTHTEGVLQDSMQTATNWKNSTWYDLGIEVLSAASENTPGFLRSRLRRKKPVASKLAELREIARTTAGIYFENSVGA